MRMYILRTPYPHIYYKRSVSMKITTKQVGARMREALLEESEKPPRRSQSARRD